MCAFSKQLAAAAACLLRHSLRNLDEGMLVAYILQPITVKLVFDSKQLVA
jgi:hypothetical protein